MSLQFLTMVRHGATEWNLAGRLQGQSDIELSPRGIDQAVALRAAFEQLRPELVVTSSLSRARATAEHGGLSIDRTDDDLREMMLGEWEGQFVKDIVADSGDMHAQWRLGLTPPPQGESFEALNARVAGALQRIVDECHDAGWQRALVVAHGGVLRSAIGTLTGLSPRYYSPISPGSLTVFEFEDPGSRELKARLKHLNWAPTLGPKPST